MQQVDNFADVQGDADFDELEAILNPKPTPDADKGDPEEGFAELDELLAEAIQDKKVAEQVKAARAKAKGGFNLSPEDLERIRRWELEKEWKAVAVAAVFLRTECSCGYHSTIFQQLMLEQKHRNDQHANRWTQQLPDTIPDLPSKTIIRKQMTAMCQWCAEEKGFPLTGATYWEV